MHQRNIKGPRDIFTPEKGTSNRRYQGVPKPLCGLACEVSSKRFLC